MLHNPPLTEAEHLARYGKGELWVFAYGSLMWRPDFPYQDSFPARLHGWHRSLCILSVHYRGTPERPGLVLGLDRGGSCHGLAYRVEPEQRLCAADILDARELTNRTYCPRFVTLHLADGRSVSAYAYTADPRHPQYSGSLPAAQQARLIRQGHGCCGSSRDYLASTLQQLHHLGIDDRHLRHILHLVDQPDGN